MRWSVRAVSRVPEEEAKGARHAQLIDFERGGVNRVAPWEEEAGSSREVWLL